ncbi:MAG: CoA transferase [Leptospiraceae bacterium]|nr:CoA transferase [Leptospiraceae bacterium]MDW7976033.1 CaiB/BaiF CoA-transferase family protein [Leptospiraceae bacterium]
MNEKKLLLEGIRVLDFSTLLPGPLCTLYLSELGAEVIKVEHPVAFDGTRKLGTTFSNSNQNTYFYLLNRNKKSLAINYKRAEGVEILKKLLPKVDILVEGFRPGMMEKIGLGYEEAAKINPKIIYVSISGFGATSIYKDYAGHDANYLAISGVLDLLSETRPTLPAVQIADVMGSYSALAQIGFALYHRERTGQGSFIDVSITNSTLPVAMLAIGDLLGSKTYDKNKTPLAGLLPNYQVYECKDKRYIVVAALEPMFLQVFLRLIQREDLWELTINGNYEYVKRELQKYFINKTYKDLDFLFQNPNSCVFPILKLHEVMEHPHFIQTQMFVEINDKEIGILKLPRIPFRFSNLETKTHSPPPKLGQHTEEILKELNISKEKMANLEKQKIILRNKE